jgi:hypothetical protein
MTRGELAALPSRTEALAAERDQAVLRREALVTQREGLYERQLAIRESIQLNLLLRRAIRIGADGALRTPRSQTRLIPVPQAEWSDTREPSPRDRLHRFDSEPTWSHSSAWDRARSAA